MNNLKPFNTEHPEDRPRIWIYFPFIVVFCVVIAVAVWLAGRSEWQTAKESNLIQRNMPSASKREIRLFYPDRENREWINETCTIRGYDSLRQEIQLSLEHLLLGSKENGRSVLPSSFSLEAVFLADEDEVIIDFHSKNEYPNLGGVTAENLAVRSITMTIAANFPSINHIRFLVNGVESETFAGHLNIQHVFKLPRIGERYESESS